MSAELPMTQERRLIVNWELGSGLRFVRSGIFDRLRVSARVLPERQRLRIAQIAGLAPIGY